MTGKRGGKRRTSWKPGQSGNPSGRPKGDRTWTAIVAEIGAMTPSDVSERCKQIAGQLLAYGDKATMKELAVMTAYVATVYMPSSPLLNFLADHEEGKLPQGVEVSWKHEVVSLLSQGKLTKEEVVEAIGSDLASELFVSAGIATTGTR